MPRWVAASRSYKVRPGSWYLGEQYCSMTPLTVTASGQVTFRKDVLQHLGIKPGNKIDLHSLPDGRGVLKAARPTATIDGFVGLLTGPTRKVPSLEKISDAVADADAVADGWAGKRGS